MCLCGQQSIQLNCTAPKGVTLKPSAKIRNPPGRRLPGGGGEAQEVEGTRGRCVERWGLLQVEVICQGLDFEEVFFNSCQGF